MAKPRSASDSGDHLGSVGLTTSSGGAEVGRQEFDAWGSVRAGSVSQTTRGFTGQYRDDTGLLYHTARYYDPAIGRFISADTVVPGSNPLTVWPSDSVASGAWGTSGNGPANPQDLNRYAYALNNPLKYTDPTGHWVLTFGYSGRIAAILTGSYNIGIAYDSNGGMATYTTEGFGAAFGGGAGAGATVGYYPEFEDVNQLQGTGGDVGVDIVITTIDLVSNDDGLVGVSATLPGTGPGFLIDVHGENTDTNVDKFAPPPPEIGNNFPATTTSNSQPPWQSSPTSARSHPNSSQRNPPNSPPRPASRTRNSTAV